MNISSREMAEAQTAMFVARVRNLQAAHLAAHEALTNWGHWSADRRGMYPRLKATALYSFRKHDENEEYGEVPDKLPVLLPTDCRIAEPVEIPDYNTLQAEMVHDRLEGYGGPPVEFKRAAKAAYVTREVPEDQFPNHCGCGEDAFCERLEYVLRYVGRFL